MDNKGAVSIYHTIILNFSLRNYLSQECEKKRLNDRRVVKDDNEEPNALAP